MLGMHNVPFKFQGVPGQEKGGLLILDGNQITLEFEVTRLLFFSDIERIHIPVIQLQEAEIQKDGWVFYDWNLILTARSLQTFRNIPGSKRELLTLHIARENGERAKRLVSALMMKITEYEITTL